MRRLLAAELVKLRATRSIRWLVLAEVLLVVAALSGAVNSGFDEQRMATSEGLRTLLEHGGIVGIVSLVIGVLLSGSEFRHGTVVDTFLTTPRREQVVAAKLLTGLVVGALAGAATALATGLAAWAWYAERGVAFSPTDADVVRCLAGITAWHALYCSVGVALGWLIRAQATAIVTAVVWLTVAETALAGLVVSAAKWLPATAARGLGYAPESGLLPQAGGGLVLLGWTAVLAGAAVVLTARRDVA